MKKLSSFLRIWPGLALGIVFALGAQVAFADPAELRLKSRELTCRESAQKLITVKVETTVLSNVPCKRVVLNGQAHQVWGCDAKFDRDSGGLRYEFDINDWPASITVQGENAILEKGLRAFPCSFGLDA